MADKVTFRLTGGDEFLADLREWRAELRAKVHASAKRQASAMAAEVKARLPRKTGNLQDHITVRDCSSFDTVLFVVESTARHSHLYEGGTKDRWTTGRHKVRVDNEWTRSALYQRLNFKPRMTWGPSGKRAYRGRMPAHPLFIPQAIRHRAVFNAEVLRIVSSPQPAIGKGHPDVKGTL